MDFIFRRLGSVSKDRTPIGGWFGFVRGEIGGGDFQIEQVLPPGQVERGRGRGDALALLQDIGDVFAAVGFVNDGIGEGAGDFVGAIDFAERDDLLHVMRCIEPPFIEFVAVELGLGT